MYKQIAAVGLFLGLPIVLVSLPDGAGPDQQITEAGTLASGQPDATTSVPSLAAIEPLVSQTILLTVPTVPEELGLDASTEPATESIPTSTTVVAASNTTAAPTNTPTTREPSTSVAPTTVAPTTAAPTTAAPTTSEPPTTQVDTPEARGRDALASIGYDWQGHLSGWNIEFSPGREGVIGYTYTYEKRIEIFVRDDMSESLLRHVIAHEIGHAVDITLNSSSDRERWQEAREVGNSPWWPGNGVNDYSTGAGDFAECFAVWQTGSSIFRSKIAPLPTGDQLNLVASLAAG